MSNDAQPSITLRGGGVLKDPTALAKREAAIVAAAGKAKKLTDGLNGGGTTFKYGVLPEGTISTLTAAGAGTSGCSQPVATMAKEAIGNYETALRAAADREMAARQGD